MKMPNFLKSTGFASVIVLSGALAGCGNIVADRCDQICKCENCGERERQECETEAQSSVDTADSYACSDLLEPYYECQLQKHECADGHYSDDDKECKDEHDQYLECLTAESSRRPGPYANLDEH